MDTQFIIRNRSVPNMESLEEKIDSLDLDNLDCLMDQTTFEPYIIIDNIICPIKILEQMQSK